MKKNTIPRDCFSSITAWARKSGATTDLCGKLEVDGRPEISKDHRSFWPVLSAIRKEYCYQRLIITANRGAQKARLGEVAGKTQKKRSNVDGARKSAVTDEIQGREARGCEFREISSHCWKTGGGPLTRFHLRLTFTSTRLAILMKGMLLFMP